MQFLRTSLAVVLATAVLPATVQGFFNCTKEDGGQIPDDIRADYDKIKEPVRGIILTILPKKDPLVEEKVYKMPCMQPEICVVDGELPMCYDEKTFMARTVVNIAVNIKTGDITLPDHTKGNVDSNIGPINYYILRHPEILTENNRTKPTESPKPTQTGDATSGAPGAGKMVAGGWVISTIAALAAAVAIAV